MFHVLRDCTALARILPEVDKLFGVPQPAEHHPEIDTGVHIMLVIDYAAARGWSLPVRFAALTHDLGKGGTPVELLPKHHGHEARSVALLDELSRRLRVPADCRDLARLAARYHGDIHRALELRPETIVKLFSSAGRISPPGALHRVTASVRSRQPGAGGAGGQTLIRRLRICSAHCKRRLSWTAERWPQHRPILPPSVWLLRLLGSRPYADTNYRSRASATRNTFTGGMAYSTSLSDFASSVIVDASGYRYDQAGYSA